MTLLEPTKQGDQAVTFPVKDALNLTSYTTEPKLLKRYLTTTKCVIAKWVLGLPSVTCPVKDAFRGPKTWGRAEAQYAISGNVRLRLEALVTCPPFL